MAERKSLPQGRALQAHARGRRVALCVREALALTGGACESYGPLALFSASAGSNALVSAVVGTPTMDEEGLVAASAVALSSDGAEAFCAEDKQNMVGVFSTRDLVPIAVVANCHCLVRALALSRDDLKL
jgi:hypothetical protein